MENPAGEKFPEIHPQQYLQVVLIRWPLVVGVVFISVLLMTVRVLRETPIYEAEGLLCIMPQNMNIANVKAVVDPLSYIGYASIQDYLATQYQLIVSDPVLEKTFYHFNFDQHKAFVGLKEPLRTFAGFFAVLPVRKSFIVKVTFAWPEPTLAARVLDFLLKAFIVSERNRLLGITGTGLKILNKKAEELRPKVLELAEQLQQFTVENNIVSMERSQNIILDRLKDISMALTSVELKRIQYQTRYKEVLKAVELNKDFDSIPEIVESITIRDIKLQLLTLRQEMQGFLEGKHFGPNHPQLKTIQAKLVVVEERLRLEIVNVLTSIRVSYERCRLEEEELKKTLDKQQQEIFKFNKLGIRYNSLRTNYEVTERSYNLVANRIEEVELANAAGQKEENMFLVSPPKVPMSPVKPQKRKMVFVTLLTSTIIAVVLCFCIEYLDTSLKTKEEVEALFKSPMLGSVPRSNFSKDGFQSEVVMRQPHSTVAEAFRSIRTSLYFILRDHFSVWVSSPVLGDGKSFFSVNIASALAQSGKKVLLVDCDFRRARLHDIFMLNRTPGVTNLIVERNLELEKVIKPSKIENLSILPAGPRPPNPTELLGSSEFGQLMQDCKQRFDYVVVDTPPVALISDAVLAGQHLDGGIMVVRSFTTPREAAQQTMSILYNAKSKLIGTILNDVQATKVRYYGSS